MAGLSLEAICHVQTTPRKATKRILVCFRKGHVAQAVESTLMLTIDGRRSPAYSALTADFYLDNG
jgi:tRNA1(Val) A37 N6-methylase TrmN6